MAVRSVNKVILLGNVGKDPEIRSTAGGTMVANFTLATSDRQKDAQGNWQDRTEWHNLVAFTRTAEIVRDYVKKGSKLYIEGKIQTRSWDDKESGEKRYRTEIIVNDLVAALRPRRRLRSRRVKQVGKLEQFDSQLRPAPSCRHMTILPSRPKSPTTTYRFSGRGSEEGAGTTVKTFLFPLRARTRQGKETGHHAGGPSCGWRWQR